jgi:hypothetical protein
MTLELASREWTIPGLPAFGPPAGMEDELALFGQFVGDWEIVECRFLENDGTWTKETGEIHWRWILGGRAIQDVWMTVDEETQELIPQGTTIRFYDPSIGAWRSTWLSPTQGKVKPFIGRKVGDTIVLERKDEEQGLLVKWIFSEITPNSFRWHAEESSDNGKSWILREEMRIRRMNQ